jgi:hypothetical protein
MGVALTNAHTAYNRKSYSSGRTEGGVLMKRIIGGEVF